MKNYEVLADLGVNVASYIEKAFDRGYDQGYQDGIEDKEQEYATALHDIEDTYIKRQKADYEGSYEDEDGKKYPFKDAAIWDVAYMKGLQHGQELRIKEAECAEACGLRKGWETARKILQMPMSDLDQVFPGWDVEHIIEKLSAKEVIEKIEAWEKKQTTTLCRKCIHANNMHDNMLTCDAVPCVIENSHCDKYQEKQEHSDIVPEPPLVDCNECAKFQVDCSGFGPMKSHCTAFKKKQEETEKKQ